MSFFCLSFLFCFTRHGDSSSTFHVLLTTRILCTREMMLCVHVYRIAQFRAAGFSGDQMCCSHTEPAGHTCCIRVIFFPENRVNSAQGMSCVLFELSLSGKLLCLLTWAGAFTEPLAIRAFVLVLWVGCIGLLCLWAFSKKSEIPSSAESQWRTDSWHGLLEETSLEWCPCCLSLSPVKLEQWKK